MPFAEVNHGRIHYRVDGDIHAPVLLCSHSLGTDLTLWEPQRTALVRSFRILRYDSRGHGRSSVAPGPCTVELLARDAVGLLDHLGISRVHFCGLSLGGMVGMWLGVHATTRVDKLILANTAAQLGSRETWDARIQSVRAGGMAAIADGVLERWFTPAFRERRPGDVAAVRRMLLSVPPEGYTACCAAIRDMDQRAGLAAIRSPTLVISGREDPATTPAMCRMLADAIGGARVIELSAAHLSNIEAAAAFNAAVLEFLTA